MKPVINGTKDNNAQLQKRNTKKFTKLKTINVKVIKSLDYELETLIRLTWPKLATNKTCH